MQFLKRLKPMTDPRQNSAANTIYVDSDTNEIKVGTGASGNSERVLLDNVIAFPGPILNGDGSASAPSYSFASETTTGWYVSAGPILTAATSGVADFAINGGAGVIQLKSDWVFSWSSSVIGAASDVSLSRGAANRLDLATGDSFNIVSGALLLGGTNIVDSSGNFSLLSGAAYYVQTKAFVRTAPTIASGFGTTPSIVASNGTAAFTINVGTGGTASSGVITMPAATTGWICHVENLTGTLGNVADQRTVQIASTTTSITVENQKVSDGTALAWAANDVLVITAVAY